jgi:hypothetical protein
MEEGDPLSFRPNSGDLIHEGHTGRTAFLEHSVEIVDRETHVVNARTTLFQIACDRRFGTLGFEQLDESVPGFKSGDSRAVAVREGYLLHAEYVTKKRSQIGERAQGDSDVRNACTTWYIGH